MPEFLSINSFVFKMVTGANPSLIHEEISADLREIAISRHPFCSGSKFSQDHLAQICLRRESPCGKGDSKECAKATKLRAKSPKLEHFNSDQKTSSRHPNVFGRKLTAAPAPSPVTLSPDPRVAQLFGQLARANDWNAFLEKNQTQAFVVIQNGTVKFENYFNGVP